MGLDEAEFFEPTVERSSRQAHELRCLNAIPIGRRQGTQNALALDRPEPRLALGAIAEARSRSRVRAWRGRTVRRAREVPERRKLQVVCVNLETLTHEPGAQEDVL